MSTLNHNSYSPNFLWLALVLLAFSPSISAQIDATYSIWNAQPHFANDPNQTAADPLGVTGHVATDTEPLSLATVYENTNCSGRPCGATYWNPVTNLFKCYGYSSGSMNGIDINSTGPAMVSGDGKTFGPGDTWLAKTTGRALTVQFPGSDSFRSWAVGSLQGIRVDQTTGHVWYADLSSQTLGLFDPSTNMTREWPVGS